MRKTWIYFALLPLLLSCTARLAVPPTSSAVTAAPKGIPIITFEDNHQVFGPIRKGDVISGTFSFQNTGDTDLLIELVSGCTCTTIDWPRSPISPGHTAAIAFRYDSALKEHIEDKKDPVVLDIVANTNPIVVEAFFTVTYE